MKKWFGFPRYSSISDRFIKF